jgi:gamma-glutamylputrescine oxidase
MLKVYPDLADVAVTHAWGGTLGITVHRAPFVRELAPGVRIAAGYSGQGVVLAPWFGKLLADAALGEGEGSSCWRACRPRRSRAGGCCAGR